MPELQPYLFFYGKCEEALEFYKSVLGGDIKSIMRMKDGPPDMPSFPGWSEKIMHARFESGAVKFQASDGRPDTQSVDGNISLTLLTDDEEETARIFGKLAEGGEVEMPLSDTFWSSSFGVLKDKYGIEWFLNCEKPSK